jgi:hypothetical protein
MRQFTTLLSILICLGLTANAQQPLWYAKAKEISLLNSNYLDVIRIYDLGSKVDTTEYEIFHRALWSIDVEEGNIQILFKQDDPCIDGSTIGPGWNVPHGTVVGMNFFPTWKKQIPLDQLPFATGDFKIIQQDNDLFRYSSGELGITFETDMNKLVRQVHFVPPSSMSFMRCSSTLSSQLSIINYQLSPTRSALSASIPIRRRNLQQETLRRRLRA